MIDRTSYEYKLLVRLYQLLERGKRLKDKEFILTVWPKLLSVTQLYIQYAKDAFTFSGMSECVFVRNRNFGLPLRLTNETIFDMCMLDERRW